MKFAHLILVFSLMTTVACSRKEKPDSDEAIAQSDISVESVASDESDNSKTDSDLVVDDNEANALKAEEPKIEESAIVEADEPQKPVEEKVAQPLEVKEESFQKATVAGDLGTYKVEKGETLMMIAFKIYGDYGKWRELAKLNPQAKNAVSSGMALQFMAPAEKFVWNPAGEPYLIKKGDTLGIIAGEKYGTPAKWKKIWDNNKPLIKNPNLIFAGFTLYYIPDNKLADAN